MQFETEAQFGRWFNDLAVVLGWKVYHADKSARPVEDKRTGKKRWISAVEGRSGKGFVDYVLVHRRTGATMFVELKRDLGVRDATVGPGRKQGHARSPQLEPEQQEWRKAIEAGPSEYHLWRPADEPEIVKRLMAEMEKVAN